MNIMTTILFVFKIFEPIYVVVFYFGFSLDL